MGEARSAMRPNTQLYNDIFHASPIGIVVENLDGQPIFVNPTFCSMLGFSEDELRSKNCFDLSPPEDAEKHWALFQQLQAGSIDRYQLEKRYFRRDGSLLWGSSSISLLKTHSSPLVIAMVEDITEKKNAEEARFRLAAIVESSEDAIGGVDTNGTVVTWNKGAERLFGYTATEAIGRNVSFLSEPDRPDDGLNLLRKVLEGAVVRNHETVRVRKDGTLVDVSVTVSPIVDAEGRIVGASGVSRDITERKLAEEALRTSMERLRLAQWAAHVGTFDLNIRTGVDIWTPETEALYGLPPGSFGGTLTAFENLIHPDDRQRVIELACKTMRTGQATEAEWRVIWPDGSVHWIAGRGQVLRDESGEPSRMLGVNIDITERKRAEAALSGMTRKLVEAQEQERARIARELHDDITQRLALLAIEIEEFLEYRDEMPLQLTERAHELSKTAREISSDIQSLSHELHSSSLEILGLEAGMKSWCQEFGERQKLQIAFQSHGVRRPPREISLCLFRVLQEALQNAAKHSGAKQIAVQLTENSGEIRLIVSDSGEGFDITAPGRRRGLGLTSMQERIRLVGGTFVIDSKPLTGTSIHVCVPLGAERD
jgi:PAS domain S-box-containing protein